MEVVNKLKAEIGSIGVYLSGSRSDIIANIAVEKDVNMKYTVTVTEPDVRSCTVEVVSDEVSKASCKIFEAGKRPIRVPAIGWGYNMHLDYYRVISDKGSSTFNLQGTDAFGSLTWSKNGCEIIADLSDDRICPDDATDDIKLRLVALMLVQSLIGKESLAMKCETYKKYYDSLTSR